MLSLLANCKGTFVLWCKIWQVAPAEIEGVLLTHPSVEDAAVVG